MPNHMKCLLIFSCSSLSALGARVERAVLAAPAEAAGASPAAAAASPLQATLPASAVRSPAGNGDDFRSTVNQNPSVIATSSADADGARMLNVTTGQPCPIVFRSHPDNGYAESVCDKLIVPGSGAAAQIAPIASHL